MPVVIRIIIPAAPLEPQNPGHLRPAPARTAAGSIEDEEDSRARRLARIGTRSQTAAVIREDDCQASATWRSGGPSILSALSALLAPSGTIATACRFSYELRLHRARGYGALKAILEVLAEEEPLTLTEIALRLRRTPGSTKDYLSWLEDVDLIVSRQKRYSFTDPMMRLWGRLHCRATPPNEEDIAREVHAYVLMRLPHAEPALALAGAPPVEGERDKSWGIIEIADSRFAVRGSRFRGSRFAIHASAPVVRAPALPPPGPLPSCSSLPRARAPRR